MTNDSHNNPDGADDPDVAAWMLDAWDETQARTTASDPRGAAHAEAVRAHLALYDALPDAPPPPPFAKVNRAVRARRMSTRRRWIAAAAAALVLVGAGLAIRAGARSGHSDLETAPAIATATIVCGAGWLDAEGRASNAGPINTGPENAGPVNAGPGNAGPVNAGPVNAGPKNAGPVNAGPGNAGRANAVPVGAQTFPQGRTWTTPATTELRWQSGGRGVHVIADANTALHFTSTESLVVTRGRVWCDIEPARSVEANDITIRFGADAQHVLRVVGTRFDVDHAARTVRVARGIVTIDGTRVSAGSRWTAGVHDATDPSETVAWLPTPRMTLEQDRAGADAKRVFSLIVRNPSAASVHLPPPQGNRTGLWMEWLDRAGNRLKSLPIHPGAVVAGADWMQGGPSGAGWTLAPGAERTIRIRFRAAQGPPGAYRCRALIRPAGAPPVLSNLLTLKED